MEQITKYIIFFLIFLLVYPFLVYPIILFLLTLITKSKAIINSSEKKSFSFIISAYNEEKNIENCVNSILSLNYQMDKIEIIIGSDGSKDKTNTILEKLSEKHSIVKFEKFPRSGKNKVLNNLIKKAENELLYFLDADMTLEKDQLNKISAEFGDIEVGGVVTALRSRTQNKNTGSIGENLYQAFESLIRKWESDIRTTTSSLGGGCFRKSTVDSIPNDTYCDDLFFVLNTALKKKRVIYLNDVKTTEGRKKSLTREFNRRIRIVSCGMAAIFGMKGVLKPKAGLLAFFIWSHKVVRWFSMFYIFLLFIFTFLLPTGEFKEWMLLIDYLIVVSIYSAYVFEKTDVKFPLLKLPLFYFIMISSFTVGFFRYLSNKQNSIWTEEGLVDTK